MYCETPVLLARVTDAGVLVALSGLLLAGHGGDGVTRGRDDLVAAERPHDHRPLVDGDGSERRVGQHLTRERTPGLLAVLVTDNKADRAMQFTLGARERERGSPVHHLARDHLAVDPHLREVNLLRIGGRVAPVAAERHGHDGALCDAVEPHRRRAVTGIDGLFDQLIGHVEVDHGDRELILQGDGIGPVSAHIAEAQLEPPLGVFGVIPRNAVERALGLSHGRSQGESQSRRDDGHETKNLLHDRCPFKTVGWVIAS